MILQILEPREAEPTQTNRDDQGPLGPTRSHKEGLLGTLGVPKLLVGRLPLEHWIQGLTAILGWIAIPE